MKYAPTSDPRAVLLEAARLVEQSADDLLASIHGKRLPLDQLMDATLHVDGLLATQEVLQALAAAYGDAPAAVPAVPA